MAARASAPVAATETRYRVTQQFANAQLLRRIVFDNQQALKPYGEAILPFCQKGSIASPTLKRCWLSKNNPAER